MPNYPDWITGFLDLTEETEPPIKFKQWVAVSTIAGCLQRKTFLVWEGNLYPNLYIMLVAPAGRARKGTAMRYGRLFLEDAGVSLAAESTTREALIRDLNESLGIVTDWEHGSGKVYNHRSLTVFNEEIAVLLNQKDTRIVRDFVDWFDCRDTWNYRTKDNTKSDLMNNVFVNLCGATQPETIESIMPREVITGGLASRMIFVYEHDKGKVVPVPPPLNVDVYEALRDDLHDILMMSGPFKTTSKFIERMVDWVHEHERNPPFQGTILESYSSRRRIHILKLCMIMNVSRSRDMVIGVEDFDRALELLTETERNMLNAFSGVGKSDIATIVPHVMRTIAMREKIMFSELLNKFHQDAERDTLMRIVANLVSMKKVKLGKRTEDGDFEVEYIFKEK